MEVKQVFHMKGGLGESSYANNSSLQREAICIVKPILEESVREVYDTILPECLRMADLGCSSGPNALAVVSEILDTIDANCRSLNKKPPVFQVFLNDLPWNDFNTLFHSLPSFYERLAKEKGPDFGPCFITAMPGSFYGRLFPNNTMHIIHSSYSIHWLRQVPKGLVNEKGEALNKKSIFISKTSPPEVLKAYLDEFQQGFILFLKCRSQEIVEGGCMVLTLTGRIEHPKSVFELLGRALYDMVSEGIIEEGQCDLFNLPYYTPSVEEVKKIIDEEGSFSLQKLEIFETAVDAGFEKTNSISKYNEKEKRGQYVSHYTRAIMESLIWSHFGETIMNNLFKRFAAKVIESIEKENWPFVNLVLSLKRKKVA